MMKPFLCVGAGFSGAVIARELAEQGYRVLVIDERAHLAGNCFTQRDDETQIMMHAYGPHIFHTDDSEVWAYIQRFSEMMPYIYQPKASYKGKLYHLPINLNTINQFFNQNFSPEEAERFIQNKIIGNLAHSSNFEEKALSTIGKELYEAFFYGYTKKQWGMEPRELPASVFSRLPVRFNADNNYFNHRYQAIPKDGYTVLVNNILNHPSITVQLNTSYQSLNPYEFAHIFYSGTIDGFFQYAHGNLAYRTLDFEIIRQNEDLQGCIAVNYTDEDVPWTRITEHKYFAYWEQHSKTIALREHSRLATQQDTPYYPIRLAQEKEILTQYEYLASQQSDVTFIGRLGTYRYLDMDVTIREALDAARNHLARLSK